MKKASKKEVQILLDLFRRFDIEELEEPELIFRHIGILDVYPKCLSEEEAAHSLGTEHNRRNEFRYKQYFQRCEQYISGPIYIKRCPIFSESKIAKEDVFSIEDSQELMAVVEQMTREECFYNVFFPDEQTAFIGNFDLSWPVYSNSEDFSIFIEIAKEVNLYIRTE
ncbi:hypothetical protein [Paenibacillus cellulosilyticus]|uniref:hypothetical protein n=1 Tax=Paenibacillus cellulosilyticus TaxID=375489 RepID=UPI00158058CD|nr:hypothetical protein [Paenibacillus cellulosilyticus]